jgi:hypothetical protein
LPWCEPKAKVATLNNPKPTMEKNHIFKNKLKMSKIKKCKSSTILMKGGKFIKRI